MDHIAEMLNHFLSHRETGIMSNMLASFSFCNQAPISDLPFASEQGESSVH